MLYVQKMYLVHVVTFKLENLKWQNIVMLIESKF